MYLTSNIVSLLRPQELFHMTYDSNYFLNGPKFQIYFELVK